MFSNWIMVKDLHTILSERMPFSREDVSSLWLSKRMSSAIITKSSKVWVSPYIASKPRTPIQRTNTRQNSSLVCKKTSTFAKVAGSTYVPIWLLTLASSTRLLAQFWRLSLASQMNSLRCQNSSLLSLTVARSTKANALDSRLKLSFWVALLDNVRLTEVFQGHNYP